MKTLKKIKNAVINTGRAIAKKPLEVILATTLSVVPVSCKNGHDDPIFPPQKPVISTVSLPDAIENSSYSTTILADDPQLDPIIYSITGGTADSFLEINPSTGELYNDTTITDAESGITHDIKIKAEDDKGNYTEKTFDLNVINTEIVTGNIKDVTDDTNLSNMEVKIGSYLNLTDASGNYTVTGVQDGNHDVEINDTTGTETDYFTHKAGKLVTNKTKNLEGKLTNINFKVIPTSLEALDTKQDVLDHIADCIRTRYDAEKDVKKWETCPTFRIYLREFSTGNPVAQASIDLVKDIINNEIEKVDPLFTTPIITEIDNTRPVGPVQDDYIDVTWNDGISGARGGNSQNSSNYTITGGYCWCDTSQGKNIWMQELTENILCGGESNIYSSVLNDFNGSPPEPENYTTVDLKLWKIHQNRPKGNKDLDSADNHDVNPNTYTINP